MAVVFHDDFTQGGADRAIVGAGVLVPTIAGTDYLELLNNSSTFIEINTSTPEIRPNADDTTETAGIIIHLNYGTINEADTDLEVTYLGTDASTDDTMWMIARYADVDNMIAVSITQHASEKAKLYKIVTGTETLLGTTGNKINNGDKVKLELRGTAWKVFVDVGAGYVEQISVTESALSASGKTTLGWGSIHSEFALHDIRTNTSEIGEVKVTEFAAAGGANPHGPFGHPFHGPFGGPI